MELIAFAAIIIVVAIAASGCGKIAQKEEKSSEEVVQNTPTPVETVVEEPTPTATATPSTTPVDEYAGKTYKRTDPLRSLWKTYERTDPSLSFRYPASWGYEEKNDYSSVSELFGEGEEGVEGVKSVRFKPSDDSYVLNIFFTDKEKYPNDNVIMRTSVGAGNMESLGRNIYIGPVKVSTPMKLVLDGKVREVFYSYDPVMVKNLEMYIFLSGVKNGNIPMDIQITSEHILSSLEVK